MGEAKRRKKRNGAKQMPRLEELEPGIFPVRERRTMGDEWKEYFETLMKPLGVTVGSTQYVETRRAFMAGAAAFMALLNTDTDPGADLTQLDLGYIDALAAEFEQFQRDLAEGRA